MWFKNLQLYRLTTPFALSPEQLSEKLAGQAFRPCGSQEPATLGWVPPLGRQGSDLVHAANGCILLCARREERLLPSTVVREAVEERALEIEEREGRKVRRKERLDIKDNVMQELMPRAFVRSSLHYAYLDAPSGWLVVNAGSAKRAEELVSLLRESVGTLPARLPATVDAPNAVMTHWLAGESAPAGFELEDECELRDPDSDGGVVRCKRQDLTAEEIQAHLRAGKRAVRLAVSWEDRLSCVVAEELAVKRLRFLDLVQETAAEVEAEDEAARMDADFSIMTLELRRFIPALLALFGGEDAEAYTPGAGTAG